MKIIVSGLLGHMGREVLNLAENGVRGAVVTGGVDPMFTGGDFPVRSFEEAASNPAVSTLYREADCIVDFSRHDSIGPLLRFASACGLPAVIATTGHTEEEKAMIRDAAESIPVFFSANMSLGIALLAELARQTAAAMPDAEIEIVEKHHDRKLDAPSGTALALFDAVREARPGAKAVTGRSGPGKRQKEDVGIHAIRMGNIVGVHEVMIGTQNETLTLTHQAYSRGVFADGSLKAAAFLIGKKPGLYDMKDLLRAGGES